MIEIIYPKGSIIGKKGEEKIQYCIVDINKDGYEVVNYPFGLQTADDKIFIEYDEVGTFGDIWEKSIKSQ